jgi:hypothetical protein
MILAVPIAQYFREPAVTALVIALSLTMTLHGGQLEPDGDFPRAAVDREVQWLNVAGAIFLPACFYIGVKWGVVGVAWAWAIGFPLSVVPAFIVMGRVIDLSLSRYFAALRPRWSAAS